jgi:ankyrin repeat protein
MFRSIPKSLKANPEERKKQEEKKVEQRKNLMLYAAAAWEYNSEKVKNLLEMKIGVDSPYVYDSTSSQYGNSPLVGYVTSCFFTSNKLDIFKLLLEHKADINYRYDFRSDFNENNEKSFLTLLTSKKTTYWTPLTAASNHCNYNFVKALLGEREANLALIKLLVDKKANIHAIDEHKHTALYYAAQAHKSEGFKLLLNPKAPVNFTNVKTADWGCSLSPESEHARSEIVKLLKLVKDFQSEEQVKLIFLYGISRVHKKKEAEQPTEGIPSSLLAFSSNSIYEKRVIGIIFSFFNKSPLEQKPREKEENEPLSPKRNF